MKHVFRLIGFIVIVSLLFISAKSALSSTGYERVISHISNFLSIITSIIAISAAIFAFLKKESISLYLQSILEARHYHTFIGPHLNRIDALIKGHEPKKAWLTGAISEVKSLYIHIQGKSYFSEKMKTEFDNIIEFLEKEHSERNPNYGKAVIKIRETKATVEESYFSPNIEVANE